MTSQLTLDRNAGRHGKGIGSALEVVLLVAGLIGLINVVGTEAPDLTDQAATMTVPLENFSGVDEFVSGRAASRSGIAVSEEDFTGLD